MKKALLIAAFVTVAGVLSSQAQRISVRLDFPVGIPMMAPTPPPFAGAIWIKPEWVWHDGRYVCVPGYWAHPQPRRVYYAPGHRKRTSQGYYRKRGYRR